MNIIKRSGKENLFSATKIEQAVKKANKSVQKDKRLSEEQIAEVVQRTTAECEKMRRAVNVEEIQDIVEKELMRLGAYNVAKSYVIYRYERSLARKGNSTDQKIISLVDCNNEEVKQENSNKNPTVASCQRDYIAGEVSKDISKRILLPKKVVDAHENGMIHFHDMDYYLQRIHNCFTGGTKFITDKGIREFRNFNDGDKVIVLASDGNLREATVRCYGVQPMQYVTLKSPMFEETITCTPNHRWILKDGTITTDLKVGDRLICMNNPVKDPSTLDEYRAWCMGFAIGDGCDHIVKNTVNWLSVRLCGYKNKYCNYFKEAGWSVTSPKCYNGDCMAETCKISKQKFLSGEGWKLLPANMKHQLMNGLFAADGCRDKNIIYTADDRVADMIRDVAGMAGMAILSEKEYIRDTPFKKGARLIMFRVVRHQADNWSWRVSKIVSASRSLPAYCVEEPVTHSFTLDKGIVTGNCQLVNLEDMLQNGTVIAGNHIDKPKSFLTACTIATQVAAAVASNCYGGQTMTLTHLAPFIDVSRKKFRKQYKELGLDKKLTTEEFDNIVEDAVRREVKAGVQTIQYQVSTIATSNGQAPFITVFMYLNETNDPQTKADLAMLIREVLEQRIQGVKNEVGVYVTPAFPKLIYVLEEDNIREGSKYWDLTVLAAKCTAKRLVPDYISEKKMLEYKVDDQGKGHCYPCMGCVDGKSVIDYRYHSTRYVETFERAWGRLADEYEVKVQPNGRDLYMDTPDVEIYDSKKGGYVAQYRMIRNTQKDWVRISLSGGRLVDVTADHPFDTEDRIVLAEDLKIGDRIPKMLSSKDRDVDYTLDKIAWLRGLSVCDSCYVGSYSMSVGLDERDVADRAQEVLKEIGYESYVKEWHRGERGNYLEIRARKSSALCSALRSMFEGVRKNDRSISDALTRGFSYRICFLAGMIDADGYVDGSSSCQRVQIGSTNRELAMQQLYLAQSCGMNASVYANKYKSESDKIRYRVEFAPIPELINLLACAKKRNLFDYGRRVNSKPELNNPTSMVQSKTFYTEEKYSYDVTTETEHFTFDGIWSHNCRSFLTVPRGDVPRDKFYGRFNTGVVTVNLPDIALSAHGDMDAFWRIFDERMEICHTALECRHKRLRGVKSDTSPIHWQHGAIARLKKGETIDSLLWGGYCTLSLGYAGLWECVLALNGKKLTEPEGEKLGLEIMQKLNDYTAKWKAAENIDYSLYGTPLESTTYKFAKCLQKRFGIVKGVTDRNYITNSYHVHVTEPIDAFAKLALEAKFQRLSPGGAISYVEVPNMQNNIPAVLSIMKFIYDNIVYAELNTKSDYCQVCGFDGEIQIVKDECGKLVWKCPKCGNTDESKLNVARRTCGYIGSQFWNQGRTQEIKERVLHVS